MLLPVYPTGDPLLTVRREDGITIQSRITLSTYINKVMDTRENGVLYFRKGPDPPINTPFVIDTIHIPETRNFTTYIYNTYPHLFSLHIRTITRAWPFRNITKHFQGHDGDCNLCGYVNQTPEHFYTCPFFMKFYNQAWDRKLCSETLHHCQADEYLLFWGLVSEEITSTRIRSNIRKLGVQALQFRSRVWNDYVVTGNTPPTLIPSTPLPPPVIHWTQINKRPSKAYVIGKHHKKRCKKPGSLDPHSGIL